MNMSANAAVADAAQQIIPGSMAFNGNTPAQEAAPMAAGNLAYIVWDENDGRYHVSFNGEIIMKAANLKYLEDRIRLQDNRKCRKYNITRYEMVGQLMAATHMTQTQVSQAISGTIAGTELKHAFSINQRFTFMSELVRLVMFKINPSVLIVGEGGIGKTYTVLSELHNAGLKKVSNILLAGNEPDQSEIELAEEDDVVDEIMQYEQDKTAPGDYIYVKGYSSARGLYDLLYENRDKIVIFDDCDSIFKDRNALNVLKAALDSYDERWVCWNVRMKESDNVPPRFLFTGSVIFISNLPMNSIDQAVRSRSQLVDLTMTDDEKLERMKTILPNFEMKYDITLREEALEFMFENKQFARKINLRTLINVIKIRNHVTDWKPMALYALQNAV